MASAEERAGDDEGYQGPSPRRPRPTDAERAASDLDEGDQGPSPKRPRPTDAEEPAADGDEDLDALLGPSVGAAVVPGGGDDFEALLGPPGQDVLGLESDGLLAEPAVPPEEAARRAFADRLAHNGVTDSELPSLLTVIRDEAPSWGTLRKWRSSALLMVYVARSSRVCRAAFVSEGMPLLGALMQDAVAALESADSSERQEAGMRALACLMCLKALPIGRATMWEHRATLGKAFDRLHKWCGKEKSALAAELRAPTVWLCRKWRRQPKPAGQEAAPEQKALRMKTVNVIAQGLMGIAGHGSPHSPAVPLHSPSRLPPTAVAVEIEAALFGRFGGSSHDYRQHARMLRSNLALHGNAELRERILAGDMDPDQVAGMSSEELAPQALKEFRQHELEEQLKASIVGKLVPQRMDSEDRLNYNANTAPPIFITRAPSSEDGLRADSGEVREQQKSETQTAPEEQPKMKTLHPMDPPSVPAFLEPPPTPFRGHAGEAGGHDDHHGHEIDVMPTPAPEDEDEEEAALIRWLTQPV